jgi:hypothetical protein
VTIMGKCGYDDCTHFAIRAIPEGHRLPLWSKEICDGCKRVVWVKYSRVDPIVYSEDDFNKEFEIDEATKQIKPRAELPTTTT